MKVNVFELFRDPIFKILINCLSMEEKHIYDASKQLASKQVVLGWWLSCLMMFPKSLAVKVVRQDRVPWGRATEHRTSGINV